MPHILHSLAWVTAASGLTSLLATPAGARQLEAASAGNTNDSSLWLHLAYIATGILVLTVVLWRQRRRQNAGDEALRLSRQRLDLALSGSGAVLWDWDLKNGETFRARFAEMLGYRDDELPPEAELRRHLVHPDDHAEAERRMLAYLEGVTKRYEAEYRMRHKDGEWRWILDRGIVSERDATGQPRRVTGTFEDVSERKQIESRLRQQAIVLQNIREGVIVTDTDSIILDVNSAFCSLTGYDRDDVVGQPIAILESDSNSSYREIRKALRHNGRWQGEIRQPRKDGTLFMAWIDFNEVRDDGRLTHYLAVFNDVTQQTSSAEELLPHASYDALTGLPGRALFEDRMDRALVTARHVAKPVAVLVGDLDHLQRVNDTLGERVGDLLLREASRRLLTTVRRDDIVARLGSDRFSMLLQEVTDDASAELVAERILATFAEPLEVDGQIVMFSFSFGLALFPRDGDSSEALLDHAETARRQAKRAGRNRYRIYSPKMAGQAADRRELVQRLQAAGERGELVLHYQPRLNLESGRITGVEALLRWRDPERGLLMPADFIAVAEESGLMVPIGEWVLEQACAQGAAWRDQALPPVEISINLSNGQLAFAGLAQKIGEVLETHRLDPQSIVLELQESGLIEDAEANVPRLEELRALGVKIAVDDFGTGSVSLPQLRQLPVDELKIDRSVVHDLAGSRRDTHVVRAILTMAESLGLQVVAEGVENEAQLAALKADGCAAAQGFYLGRPVPPEELLPLLRKSAELIH